MSVVDPRAARGEYCFALSRSALAAFIELVDAPQVGTSFDTFQLLEYNALTAGAKWAQAILDPTAGIPPPGPTPLPVQTRPHGTVLPASIDPADPGAVWPPGTRPVP